MKQVKEVLGVKIVGGIGPMGWCLLAYEIVSPLGRGLHGKQGSARQ